MEEEQPGAQAGQTFGRDVALGREASRRQHGSLKRDLLDLAYDVSSYLRHHPLRSVRISAALLVAASLSACSDEGASVDGASQVIETTPLAAPLDQEVRAGLPSAPGRYPIDRSLLVRDTQGVYHFAWRNASDSPSTRNYASLSNVRLAQAETDELEVLAQGDPTLHLRGEEPIPLVASEAELRQPTPESGTSHSVIRSHWYPFPVGGMWSEPRYYDPPRSVPATGEVRESRSSTTLRPSSERTVGLPHAVGGRAGGTGSGTAASMKSGAGIEAVRGDTSVSKGVSGAKSAGFSSGKSSSSIGSSSS